LEKRTKKNDTENGTQEDITMAEDDVAEDDRAVKSKDIQTARMELLQNIYAAHATSKYTVDFLTLLLSKENPQQAAATLPQDLRQQVGIGTLGATMLDAPSTVTQSRVADNKMIAIGKRLVEVNNAAEVALAAANRLRKEITAETRYWNDILTVKEKGWSIAPLPDDPSTMGVKVGFSNASPNFRADSVVPLRRAEDGSIHLELGKTGGDSKRLLVRILKNEKLVGESSLPDPLPSDAPLDDRVREARDSLFYHELWHELNREGRTLLAHGIHLEKDKITYTADSSRTITFQLVSLEDPEARDSVCSSEEDYIAQTIALALALLLSNAHRQTQAKRAEKSAMSGNRPPPPPYSLLLPIITYYRHEKSLETCVDFFTSYCNVLQSAGLKSSFTMTEQPLHPSPSSATPTEALAATLLNPSDVQFDLTITPDSRLRILTRSCSSFGMRFAVYILPSSRATEAGGAESKSSPAATPTPPTNPLETVFPPAIPDGWSRTSSGAPADVQYDTTGQLFRYLHQAVPRALTWHCSMLLAQGDGIGTPIKPTWIVGDDQTSLADDDMEKFDIHFDFPIVGQDPGYPELHVTVDSTVEGKRVHKDWRWTDPRRTSTAMSGGNAADAENSGNLEDIVREVLSGASAH